MKAHADMVAYKVFNIVDLAAVTADENAVMAPMTA